MISALGRQLRGRFGDVVAILVLAIIGTATMLGILSQQKAALPAWIPVLGQEFFPLEAEFSTGQAVMPGQGQAITIAGVQVGKISTVRLEGGKAIIGMNVEPEYARLINTDAQMLLRPKTNLNDMVIDVELGSSGKPIAENSTVPVANTAPNVNPEEFINALDGDTQQYLRLLLSAGAEGLRGDGGEELGDIFRQFYPFVRDVKRLNVEVAKRRRSLARVIHNFRLVAEELGRHDTDIMRWVSSSSDVIGAFADESEAIKSALQELPSTLAVTNRALKASDEMTANLRPALTGLIPQAKALGPAMDASAEMFKETAPVIKEQVRPFTKQILPVLTETSRGSSSLEQTVTNFGGVSKGFNRIFNLLAFNPGEQNPGYLFYLPWMNHNTNANYLTYDAGGPIRRGSIFFTCQTGFLAQGAAGKQAFLKTLLQATNVPTAEEMAPVLNARGVETSQSKVTKFCVQP